MRKSITPFVKWAGGKRQLLKEIEKRLPISFDRIIEPFVGGGAVFLHIEKKDAIINDLTSDLINAYKIIRDKPEEIISKMNELQENHKNSPKEFYYNTRSQDREESFKNMDEVYKAARFIYLNKTCFNGLYRVNRSGYFNVPFNQKEEVKIYDKENILNISNYLKNSNIKILNEDFEKACEGAQKGDFIFFDPPYDTLKKDTFDSYTNDPFGVEGQKRLAKLFKRLDKKGCYVMLTNHNTDLINELYNDFNIDVVNVKRMINSDAKNRVGEETIIYNYKIKKD